MNEQDEQVPYTRYEIGDDDFGKIEYSPRYNSLIPRAITLSILQEGEGLPKELPTTGSSMIEDFIIEKIRQGIASPEQIAGDFVAEGLPDRIHQYIETVYTLSNSLNWNEVFNDTDAMEIQTKVCMEMEAMGMTPEQVSIIAGMRINITESIGSSSLSMDAINISRLQIVRKAMDYVQVFGETIPLKQILKMLMASVIGHELGHRIDDIAGNASNNIPMDESWKIDGDTGENRRDRFAEFWGRSVCNHEENQTRQREWLIHLNKVAGLWNSLETYNSTHEDKVDLTDIFYAITEIIDGRGIDINNLFLTRLPFYDGNEVENYASPYPREIVAAAVKPEQITIG